MWDAGLWTCALFAASALSLGLAIQVANGALAPEAIGYLSWASAAAVLSLAVPRFRRSATRPLGATAVALGMTAAVAYQAGFLAFTPPGIYLRFSMEDMRLFARGVVAAAVLAAGAVQGQPRTRRWFIGMLLALYGAMGVWIVRSSPSPHIDVFVFQRDACAALLAGKNPYAMTFPNIYGDATPFYGRDLSAAGRLQFGFVYPPLSLFLALPGHLLGDYRYSHVAAIVGAAALMAFARRGPLGAAAAALYLLTPRSFFVIEQGWTEPFVVLLLAAVVFVACRARWALPYALGLFLCVKQYLVVALVPSLLLVPWADRKAARGFVIRVAATALVVTLPLALCNPRAFWADVVMLQTFQPFRADALSYLAWFSRDRPRPLPTWISFAVAGVVTVVASLRLRGASNRFAAAVALTFLAFFAFNKQAFANYYFFVIGAFCCAIAAESRESVGCARQA